MVPHEWIRLKQSFLHITLIWISIGLLTVLTISPVYAIVAPSTQPNTTGSSAGYFDIICNVDGARVYLDTQFMGFIENGKFLVTVTRVDKYTTLTIEKDGYQTYRSQLYAYPDPGETIFISVRMTQDPYEGTGTVHIDGEPVGIGVTMDGIRQGSVPDSGVMILTNVPSGNHKFSFELAGFQRQENEEYVNVGAVTRIRIQMSKDTAGILSVSSQPQGAGVYLNDVYKGITPVILTDVPLGTYTLLLRMDGFSDWGSTVSVTGGEEQNVDASLTALNDIVSPVATQSEQNTERSGPAPLIGIAAVSLLGLYLAQKKRE